MACLRLRNHQDVRLSQAASQANFVQHQAATLEEKHCSQRNLVNKEAFARLMVSASSVKFLTSTYFSVYMCIVSHLEEKLLDQAQAQAPYSLIFRVRSHTIPQGMFSEV